MYIKIILFSFLLFQAQFLSAQNSDASLLNKKFTTKELLQDLAIIKDSLQLVHPALYRYQTSEQFETGFNTVSSNLSKVNSVSGFYSLVSPLLSSVGDLHTTIELPDEFYSEVASNSLLIPVDIRIIDNKIFVVSDNTKDSSVGLGNRILKINDRKASDVIGEMKKYFSAEGSNQTFKTKRIEQRFAFLHSIAYGESRKIRLEILSESKNKFTRNIDALPFAVIRQNRAKNQKHFPAIKSLFVQEPFLSLSVDDQNKNAVLTIKWFQNDVLESAGLMFKKFIDSAFSRINEVKVKNLIIDIRNNGGGESANAAYLYSWLSDRPFRFLYAMDTNRINYGIDSIAGVRYEYVRELEKYRTRDSNAGEQRFFGLDFQHPQENNFRGNVYVLIDGLTVSAAPQFAALIKNNRRGVLIGEEAPGTINGGSGRGYSYFRLPNTGMLVMISQYRLYLTDPESNVRDQCVRPDLFVSKTIRDIIKGKDPEMDLAEKMIKKNLN
ncbi:S41 family peptidase [Pollutibacter soli]|uniref:S41 family peptidase n=1 Tax=Pollutibacter soli TaxID=3034157 RepID=UPI0030137C9C